MRQFRCLSLFVLLVALSANAVAAAPSVDAEVAAVRVLITGGKNDQAEKDARALLARVEQQHGPEDTRVATVLEVLIEALIGNGKGAADDAVALATRAQTIRDKATPEGDPSRAYALDAWVKLRVDRGEYDQALAPAEQALKLREDARVDEALIARSLSSVGLARFYRQEFDQATIVDARALEILERLHGPEHPDTLNALNALATDEMRTGLLQRAREHLERLVATNTKLYGPEHLKTGAALTNLAIVHKDMGDYVSARPLFMRAIAIKEKTLGPEHRRLVIDLQNLAVLERELGNDRAAQPILERCLRLLEKAYGENHPDVANIHADLSITARRLGDRKTARVHAEKAVAIDRATGDEHSPDYGADLITLGSLELVEGRLEQARALFEQALPIMSARMGDEHPYTIVNLINLAQVNHGLRDYARAAPYVERVWRIASTRLVVYDPWYLDALLLRAEHAAGLRRYAEAAEIALQATTLAREQMLLNLRTLPESDALRYVNSRPSGATAPMGLPGSVIDTRATAFWEAALQSRALVLNELFARREAAHADPEAAKAHAAWVAANQAYARQLVVGYRDPEQRRALDDARATLDRAETSLAEASAEFRAARHREATRVDDIAKALPERTALVAYWRMDTTRSELRDGRGRSYRLGAFVLVDRAARPRFVDLGDAATLDALADTWRKAVMAEATGGDAKATRAAGETLRVKLWDPVARLLRDPARVLIVPDGAALQISFAALPSEDGFLVEHSPPLHLIDDERDLLTTRGARGEGLLALGGPDFDLGGGGEPGARALLRDGPCRSLGHASFAPLPQAAVEARDVAAVWQDSGRAQAIVLTGGDATEEAFKQAAAGKRVLHLATHGIVTDTCAPEAGATRGLSVSNGDASSKLDDDAAPLSLYGLALAGANARATRENQDDGVLTAEEIAALDLRAAEWVVLSSCDSARGAIASGEGMLGLRRAVRVAGAGTSIMSLWPVEDNATRAWMEDLYQARLRDGRDTADAMWQAHRAFLAARRKAGESTAPFFWGAFVASGDWH